MSEYNPRGSRPRLRLGFLLLIVMPSLLWAQQQGVIGKPVKRWTEELNSQDASRRRNAAFALGRSGPLALAAVPKLVFVLRDSSPSVREAAAYALGEIGASAWEETFPALANLLASDKEPLVRRSAAFALGSLAKDGLGPEDETAPKVRQVLEKALADTVPAVRQNAAWALGQLGAKEAQTSVPVLIQGLKDVDPLVRRESAAALGNLRSTAHDAAPALVAGYKTEKDAEVRKAALISLVAIVNPKDKGLAADLRPILKEHDPDLSRLAALSLAGIGGPEAAPAVPILCGSLREHDVEIRRQAAAALARIGSDAAAGVASLTEALTDADPLVRRNAALALGQIGEKSEPAVPALTKVLATKSEAHEIRLYAAEALAQISPRIEPAIPVLLQVLQQETDYHLRQRAVLGLGRLDEIERQGIVAALTGVLSETDPATRPVRYDAAVLLGIHLGARSPAKVLDLLAAYLSDKDIQLYTGASAQVGSAGREFHGDSTAVSPNLGGDCRFQAALALSRIGRSANRPDIIRGLQEAAKSSDTRVRESALAALREIQK